MFSHSFGIKIYSACNQNKWGISNQPLDMCKQKYTSAQYHNKHIFSWIVCMFQLLYELLEVCNKPSGLLLHCLPHLIPSKPNKSVLKAIRVHYFFTTNVWQFSCMEIILYSVITGCESSVQNMYVCLPELSNFMRIYTVCCIIYSTVSWLPAAIISKPLHFHHAWIPSEGMSEQLTSVTYAALYNEQQMLTHWYWLLFWYSKSIL